MFLSGRLQDVPEACTPSLAKPGEVWRTLAKPQCRICENLPHIHQSSGGSGESKWQPLNGSRRMVQKSATTDGQKRSETDIPKKWESERKGAKTVENERKEAKKCENRRPKTVRSRHPKKGKRAEKCENGRKRAKRGEKVRKRSGCFSLTVFCPCSSGHIAVAI